MMMNDSQKYNFNKEKIFKMIIGTIESYRKIYVSQKDKEFIKSAVDLLVDKLGSKARQDGTPAVVHSINVALKCISYYKLYDRDMIVAALLHDIVEDSMVSIEEIKKEFGTSIAYIVDGLTKFDFDKVKTTKAEREAASMLKLLVYAQKDIRILLIKFLDRIDNLESIYVTHQMQKYVKTKEAEDIFIPLADILSVWIVKQKLENLSFRLKMPKIGQELYNEFYDYKKKVFKGKDPEKYIKETIVKKIVSELKKNDIRVISTRYREKSLASIFRKLSEKNINKLSDIHDIFGIKIILDKESECYKALDIIKKMFPNYERIKDYIKKPKENGYKSIHIVVKDPKLKFMLEIQIKTEEMEAKNEYGAASHILYKGWDFGENQLEDVNRIYTILEKNLQQKRIDKTFEITVYTPKKEAIKLPSYSTVLDLAYKIHTDLGNHCKGAIIKRKIDEKIETLDPVEFNESLENGDEVEILTDPNMHPAINWLLFVRTQRAYKNIKNWLKQYYSTEEIISILKNTIFKRELGEKSPIFSIISELYGNIYPKGLKRLSKSAVENPLKLDSVYTIVNMNNGHEIINYEIAICCSPLFGEEIVGIKEENKIIVHKADCPEIKDKKTIPLKWKPKIGAKKWETKIYFSLKKPMGRKKINEKIKKLINPVLKQYKHQYDDIKIEFNFNTLAKNNRQNKKVVSGYINIFINTTAISDKIMEILLNDKDFDEVLPNC